MALAVVFGNDQHGRAGGKGGGDGIDIGFFAAGGFGGGGLYLVGAGVVFLPVLDEGGIGTGVYVLCRDDEIGEGCTVGIFEGDVEGGHSGQQGDGIAEGGFVRLGVGGVPANGVIGGDGVDGEGVSSVAVNV